MHPETDLNASSSKPASTQIDPSPRSSVSHAHSAPRRTTAFWLIPCAALAVLALALAADALGQKPHPGVPYYGPGAGNSNGQPSQQYAQSAQQNDSAPPQVQEPPEQAQPVQQPQYSAPPQSYPDPQQTYAPPPDQQPQYAPQQPQYAPQYSAPQQPYASQPYPEQPPNGDQAEPYAEPAQSQAAGPVQSLSAEDLEQLLAPIALYPDSLLAQILAASTYPAEVAIADQWVQQMRAAGYGSPDQIAAGANAQSGWDPSVKALTAFPDVLDMLNHDLQWTTNLGNAYYNQPQDVMQTVQVLRQRAEQAGNLQSTPQEDVETDQGYIDLAPTNPQFVYVPTYNPWAVYGPPIAPYPGFSFVGALGNFFGGVPIQYGLCFALGAFDRMPFGWLAWGLDWLGHAILFDHSGYYTRSRTVADWGLPRGGPRAYGRGDSTYARGGSWGLRGNTYQANGGRGYNQGGTYPRGRWTNDAGARGAESYSLSAQDYARTEPRQNYGYTRPALPSQQAYNRMPEQNYGYRPQTYPNRAQTYMNRGYEAGPQSYSNPGARYGYTGRFNYGYNGPQNYAARPGFTYSNPSQAYRAPQNYSRGYSSRSYENYGNTVARNARSGGFHPFGGGEPRSFSERAPKYSYKAPKSFGGGHQSFGGGHEKAPKMSHSGGGRRRH